MEKNLTFREFLVTRLIRASGYSAIIFVLLIFFFLLRQLQRVLLGDNTDLFSGFIQ